MIRPLVTLRGCGSAAVQRGCLARVQSREAGPPSPNRAGKGQCTACSPSAGSLKQVVILRHRKLGTVSCPSVTCPSPGMPAQPEAPQQDRGGVEVGVQVPAFSED